MSCCCSRCAHVALGGWELITVKSTHHVCGGKDTSLSAVPCMCQNKPTTRNVLWSTVGSKGSCSLLKSPNASFMCCTQLYQREVVMWRAGAAPHVGPHSSPISVQVRCGGCKAVEQDWSQKVPVITVWLVEKFTVKGADGRMTCRQAAVKRWHACSDGGQRLGQPAACSLRLR
jgi:hypothetical protein